MPGREDEVFTCRSQSDARCILRRSQQRFSVSRRSRGTRVIGHIHLDGGTLHDEFEMEGPGHPHLPPMG